MKILKIHPGIVFTITVILQMVIMFSQIILQSKRPDNPLAYILAQITAYIIFLATIYYWRIYNRKKRDEIIHKQKDSQPFLKWMYNKSDWSLFSLRYLKKSERKRNIFFLSLSLSFFVICLIPCFDSESKKNYFFVVDYIALFLPVYYIEQAIKKFFRKAYLNSTTPCIEISRDGILINDSLTINLYNKVRSVELDKFENISCLVFESERRSGRGNTIIDYHYIPIPKSEIGSKQKILEQIRSAYSLKR